MKDFRNLLIFLALSLFLAACSTLDKNSDTPEGAYAIAEEFEQSERYDEAVKRYNEVKNKFPYSSYATKAELAIADVHFKDEAYAEAQLSYQSFRELHPKHPQIDYVIFRIGLSYYKQLPETIDRDLSLAHDAVTHFEEVLKNYPQSQYAKESQERKDECEKKLAEKEEYIADFYYKQEMFLAAYGRYDGLYKRYSHFVEAKKILSRAAISAHKSSRTSEARQYLNMLKSNHAETREYEDARKVID